MKNALFNFLTQKLNIENVTAINGQVPSSISKFFKNLCRFKGLLENKTYHFECRFTDDQTILDLNLVDFIPFYENGIHNLHTENFCIIYFCDFDWEEKDQLHRTITNEKFILSNHTKEIKHIYLFRKFWKPHIYLEPTLTKPFPVPEFNKRDPESRFIMGYRSKGLFKKNTDNLPLISIVMPTFNSEKSIEQSIQSVIYQNYTNYELLIVDGLSTDSTLDIVKKYEKYIDGVISEKDKNIFDAINKGTYVSRGEYSVFLGSDDLLMPFSLEKIYENICKVGYFDYFWGDMLTLKENKDILYKKCFLKSKNYGEFFISHPSLYIRRNVFVYLGGFNINYDICADADFELKLIINNKKGFKIHKPMCVFRSGGNSKFQLHNIYQVKKIFSSYNAKLGLKYYKFVIKSYLIYVLRIIIGDKYYKKINKFFN